MKLSEVMGYPGTQVDDPIPAAQVKAPTKRTLRESLHGAPPNEVCGQRRPKCGSFKGRGNDINMRKRRQNQQMPRK